MLPFSRALLSAESLSPDGSQPLFSARRIRDTLVADSDNSRGLFGRLQARHNRLLPRPTARLSAETRVSASSAAFALLKLPAAEPITPRTLPAGRCEGLGRNRSVV